MLSGNKRYSELTPQLNQVSNIASIQLVNITQRGTLPLDTRHQSKSKKSKKNDKQREDQDERSLQKNKKRKTAFGRSMSSAQSLHSTPVHLDDLRNMLIRFGSQSSALNESVPRFNILLLGVKGSGKSSLIDTFSTALSKIPAQIQRPSELCSGLHISKR